MKGYLLYESFAPYSTKGRLEGEKLDQQLPGTGGKGEYWPERSMRELSEEMRMFCVLILVPAACPYLVIITLQALHLIRQIALCNLYSSKADWKLNKTESPVEPVETLLCLTQGGSDSAWGLGSGRRQTAFLTNCQVNRRLPVGEPTWRTTTWTDIRWEEVLYSVPGKGSLAVGYLPLKHISPQCLSCG